MKRYSIFLVVLFISSCVPSIHPLYHVEDLILDDRLLGTWGDNENKGEEWDSRETWKFEKLPGKKGFLGSTSSEQHPGYLLTITQKGKPALFEARLLKLDDQLFLDLFPWLESTFGDFKEIENDWLEMHLLPVHTFARVRFENESLVVEPFDPGFITKLLEEKKIRITHEETRDSFILTAGTDELQKFVTKFGREEDAYIEPGVFSKL